jgi:hypothetical protein
LFEGDSNKGKPEIRQDDDDDDDDDDNDDDDDDKCQVKYKNLKFQCANND